MTQSHSWTDFEASQDTYLGQRSRNDLITHGSDVANTAGWGDGNITSTSTDDYYRPTGPASAGQPYFWDIGQTQNELAVGPNVGFDNTTTIQDQENMPAIPSTNREYCFGMVSTPNNVAFRSYHAAMVHCFLPSLQMKHIFSDLGISTSFHIGRNHGQVWEEHESR